MAWAKTYLVTGGCGFIGLHLVQNLLAEGHAVCVLDDLSTGQRALLPPEATLIIGDVANAAAVEEAMEGVDGCFHLAAVASVQRCSEAWVESHRANLSGTVTIMDAARRKGIPVIYASSAAVYGDNPAIPLVESSDCRPLSSYGADKLGGELHARAAAAVHGLNSIGLRFFNVYGPGQDPASPYSGVISIFGERLLSGKSLTIFGDGKQLRDFVYVGDVVAALAKAMEQASQPASIAEVFNVCTGRAVSILDLAKAIALVSGRAAEVTYAPRRPGDILASLGDPSRISFHLGWRAGTSLEAGLEKTLHHLEISRQQTASLAGDMELKSRLQRNSAHLQNHRSGRESGSRSSLGRTPASEIPQP